MLITLPATAAEPSKKQYAAIMARALSYELTLDERAGSAVAIAVIYKSGDAESEASAENWLQAFRGMSALKIKDKPFSAMKLAHDNKELSSTIDKAGIDVLLAADGAQSEAETLTRLSRTKRLLTMSDDPAAVQKDMTLCVTEQDGKPKVIINLKVAELERIRFSSNLLKVAKLIR
jgi:hypothetical protein